ncbi:30S ribosome-binding factor RbfA [Romboutsia hominis]|nr:30S ribosome-binding factor RbfA [Romboutsia hominis]MCH1968755.1 30S ribosome-binding factor RbfA [Romboutsia hominis]
MLISGIKDPRINSMVSVTDVEVTSDLSYAYVYISILGGDEESTLTGLRSAVNYIRREVSRNVKLRHTPQIIFKVDDSIKNGMYMDTLIKKVNEGKTANEIDEEMFDEE